MKKQVQHNKNTSPKRKFKIRNGKGYRLTRKRIFILQQKTKRKKGVATGGVRAHRPPSTIQIWKPSKMAEGLEREEELFR